MLNDIKKSVVTIRRNNLDNFKRQYTIENYSH